MKKSKGAGLSIRIGVLLFSVYAVVTLISLQFQIQSKRTEHSQLLSSVEEQKLRNAEIEAVLENKDDPEYIAKIARDKLGYISPGEKVFINISN